jgi:hypothetical protein
VTLWSAIPSMSSQANENVVEKPVPVPVVAKEEAAAAPAPVDGIYSDLTDFNIHTGTSRTSMVLQQQIRFEKVSLGNRDLAVISQALASDESLVFIILHNLHRFDYACKVKFFYVGLV